MTKSGRRISADLISAAIPVPVFMPRPDLDVFAGYNSEPSSQTSSPLLSVHVIDGIDDVPRISAETAAKLISDPLSHNFDYVLILDTRFEYEFKGGHIRGAINVNCVAQLYGIYNRYKGRKVCIIFHCEFSKNRSKKYFQKFRDYDRRQHISDYPNLSFPDMYLLNGGYRQFFYEHKDLCSGGYVEMRAAEFIESGELRRCHGLFVNDLAQRSLKRYNSQPALPLPSLSDDEIPPLSEEAFTGFVMQNSYSQQH